MELSTRAAASQRRNSQTAAKTQGFGERLHAPPLPAAEPMIASVAGRSGDSWLDDFLQRDDPDDASATIDAPRNGSMIELAPIEPQEVLEEDDSLDATLDIPAQSLASNADLTSDFALAPLDDEPAATFDSPSASAAPHEHRIVDSPGSPPTPPTEQNAPVIAATTDAYDRATLSTDQTSPIDYLPVTLGGYRLVDELGRGAMGAVYRASQLSLNREVAVKVIQPHLASDPYFVARFTREAYAAAQLTHHNVVQIYDLGESRRLRYFSMEFVRGRNLGQLLQEQGRLGIRDAAGYVLQAARGLKFAHDHGLIHRDIKPENLMLSDDGVVKVADLGLVKSVKDDNWRGEASTRAAAGEQANSSGMTMAHAAMGTPAYMPPEQADNAAGVDHRADIYSLGCTFYTLLAGRPPFTGKTVVEIMTKHKTGQFTPPQVAVDGLPQDIAELTTRMMARRPEARQRDMSEVIAALTGYLGQAAERYTPRRDHIEIIEKSTATFYKAPLASVGLKLWGGFYVVCLLLLLVGGAAFGGVGAGFAIGLAMLTPVIYGLVRGTYRRSHVLTKLREYVVASGLALAGKMIVAMLLVGGLLSLVGWLPPWGVAAVVATGIAVSTYRLVDVRVARSRKEPLDSVVDFVRRLRSRGVEESAIQLAIAEHAGPNWEEFYEALFGYEAKMAMRCRMNLPGREADAVKFGAWRDGLVTWLEWHISAKRTSRERLMLAKIERDKLRAAGLTATEARGRANAAAAAIVDQAAELKQIQRTGVVDPARKRQMIKGMLMAARLEAIEPRSWTQRQLEGVGRGIDFALGLSVRMLAGLVLLVGCAAWMDQNGLIPWRPLELITLDDVRSVPIEELRPYVEHMGLTYGEPCPLVIDLVPLDWTSIFYSLGTGLAGLTLLLSALLGGRWNLLFMLPAAYVLMFGELFNVLPPVDVPGVMTVPAEWLVWSIGGALAFLGLIVGRATDH